MFKFFLDIFFTRVHVRQLFLFRLKTFKYVLDSIFYRCYNVKRGHFGFSGLCLNRYLSLQGVHTYHVLRNVNKTLISLVSKVRDVFHNLGHRFLLYLTVCDFFFKVSERLLMLDCPLKILPWSVLVMYLRYNHYRNFRFYFYYWIYCRVFFLCKILEEAFNL